MSTSGDIRVGDVGTKLRATIMENGTALNISSASVKKLRFIGQDGISYEKPAEFDSDGADGKIYYETEVGFLNVAGLWKIQGYIEIGTWKGSSTIATFVVAPNIIISA